MTTATLDKVTLGMNSIQNKPMTTPLVTAKYEPAITTQWRNDSQTHAQEEYSKSFKLSRNNIIVIATICPALFIFVFVIVLFLYRTRATYNSCFVCQRYRNEPSIPDIEINRRSIYSGSPENVRPVSMDIGTYNVNNGQWYYQSINQSGKVKKFVTFSPITDETDLSTDL
jgi:hypothetical protein